MCKCSIIIVTIITAQEQLYELFDYCSWLLWVMTFARMTCYCNSLSLHQKNRIYIMQNKLSNARMNQQFSPKNLNPKCLPSRSGLRHKTLYEHVLILSVRSRSIIDASGKPSA